LGFGRRNGERELDFGDEPRPRWFLFGAVALVLVAVVVLFLVMRGSSQTAEGPPAGVSTTEDFNPAGQESTTMNEGPMPETTASETTNSQTTESETPKSGSESGSESGSGSSAEGDSGDGNRDGSDGSGSSDGSGQSGEDVQRAGPEPGSIPGATGGGEGNRETESESAAKEPGVFDPAGKNPEPGDLTDTDKQRVEFAASQFVTAVYGYTGDDAEEYVNEIGRTVVGEEFYKSPGGQKVRDYSEEVDVYGVESAAKVDRFEVKDTEPGKVVGMAHFDTADSYSRYGDLEGDKTRYTQKLTLVAEGEIYKVFSAEIREES
jgi:hypothetical protein